MSKGAYNFPRFVIKKVHELRVAQGYKGSEQSTSAMLRRQKHITEHKLKTYQYNKPDAKNWFRVACKIEKQLKAWGKND